MERVKSREESNKNGLASTYDVLFFLFIKIEFALIL